MPDAGRSRSQDYARRRRPSSSNIGIWPNRQPRHPGPAVVLYGEVSLQTCGHAVRASPCAVYDDKEGGPRHP